MKQLRSMADTEIHNDNLASQFVLETTGWFVNRAFGYPDYLLQYSYPNNKKDIKTEVVVENRKATVTVTVNILGE